MDAECNFFCTNFWTRLEADVERRGYFCWKSSGVKWIRLSRQTSQVCRPGVSIGVTGISFVLRKAISLRLGSMRESSVPQAIHRRRRLAVLGSRDASFGVVEVVDRGAEAADPGELVGVGEADFETFKAAHREAGDSSVVAVPGDVVLGLHSG